MIIILCISYSFSLSGREIAVFWLYKFALSLKLNGHCIADDNSYLIILAWVLLHEKVTLRPRKNGCHFVDDWMLGLLESLTVHLLSLVTLTMPLTGHCSFQPSCHRTHTSVSSTLRPRQNGPLFSSRMFKTPDIFIMNPLEYELRSNIKKILFCTMLCCSEGTQSI